MGDYAIAIIFKRRDSLGLFVPLSPATRTPPRAGKSEETTPRRRRVANESQCRQTFVLQHRIVTLIARNRRFTVDLSGTRPRRWKSEFLSTQSNGHVELRSRLSGNVGHRSTATWTCTPSLDNHDHHPTHLLRSPHVRRPSRRSVACRHRLSGHVRYPGSHHVGRGASRRAAAVRSSRHSGNPDARR